MTDRQTVNRDLWNKWTKLHLDSALYDLEGFKAGATSLIGPELGLLGNIQGKRVLHLQCHFGLDSLSMARMGASVVGVDLSDEAVVTGNRLAEELKLDAQFVCADVLDMKGLFSERFDLVYVSYGALIWLSDLTIWAETVAHYLKPGGRFVLVEFHPLGNLFDEEFKGIEYTYFRADAVVENEAGSYAAPEATDVTGQSMTWDFSLSEVIRPLLRAGLSLQDFNEYKSSPYDLYKNSIRSEDGGYQVARLKDSIPYVFSLDMVKPEFYTDLKEGDGRH